MCKYSISLSICLIAVLTAGAQIAPYEIKGIVSDSITKESLIGVTVYVKGSTNESARSGLDGSFVLKTKKDAPVLCFSYVGYVPVEVAYRGSDMSVLMSEDAKSLSEVVVVSNYNGSTEARAIEIERNAANVINVLGSRAMELAPDVTVGNIIQ